MSLKEHYIGKLRAKKTTCKEFREAANQLAHLLAQEAGALLPTEQKNIVTPFGTAKGTTLAHPVTLYPILRSGLALVPPFLTYLPNASIGVIGIRRDEKTALPIPYYENLPPVKGTALMLDPMLATGGTAEKAISILIDQGYKEEHILFVGVVCSQPGLDRLQNAFPKVRFLFAATDPELNAQKWIVPGLGDFGDRYFDTPVA